MKIIFKFLILSVALALTGNRFVLSKGNNSNSKMLKVYNFRIKSGIGKWSITNLKNILFENLNGKLQGAI